MNNLSSNLKYLMEQKEIKLAKLAAVLDLAPEQLARIKEGELENPPLNTAIRISKHFGVPLETLALGKLS